MHTVRTEDITNRLPVRLTPDQTGRVGVLIADATELIEVAFQKAGRSLDDELATVVWLPAVVRRVIREMVAAAIIIGPDIGLASMTTTAGAVTEQRSFTRDTNTAASFAGVILTDDHLSDLGLATTGPRGHFPPAPTWPEVTP